VLFGSICGIILIENKEIGKGRMDKYLIKVTGRGFLKDVLGKKWSNFCSKDENLSRQFDDAISAEEYRLDTIKAFTKTLTKATPKFNKLKKFVADIDSHTLVEIKKTVKSLCDGGIPWRFRDLQYVDDWRNSIRETFKDGWGAFYSITSDYNSAKRQLRLVSKSKIIKTELGIKFFPNKKRKISWEKTEQFNSVGDRLYCVHCGGVIPNTKYLRIPSESGNGTAYICAFCIEKIAIAAEPIINAIDPEFKKQYKKDAFVHNL